MEIRTLRRGFAALAIAAILGLAGAYPAAAAEPGWFERGLGWLAGLWSAEDTAAKAQAGDGLVAIWTMSTADKGMGLDPNGEGTQTLPPPGEGQ